MKGDVYLSNDKAERKASGSYYTPDAIVEYIVEQTVGPVLSEKLETLRGELRKVRKTFDNELAKLKVPPSPEPVRAGAMTARDFAAAKTYETYKELVEQIFDFRTLDPAMGSGHFLVEAVDFITDRLLTFLNQFPVNPVSFMLDRTRRNIMEALGEQGVTVDPDKLTEVNLLKRHVLKRCIYGVDLNPMAVELAKVSLWLDAFTIGAPLSFLDHHLRCGNSLIGATFKDLEAATQGQLFSIDYEPLLRAIRHVIQVNQMADATAAEVKHSATEYGAAREELSGYQIVLDLLVARHFGFPNAAKLLAHYGKELDLANRQRFMASLEDLDELATAERVTALSQQPDRRFFHWEIEFPEVFFDFADREQRHIKHKNGLKAGSEGFDAVVGNPPWGARLDRESQTFCRNRYEGSRTGILDSFALFLEAGLMLSRSTAIVGVLLPDIFLLKNYPQIRRLVLERTEIISLLHWGMPFREVNLDVCSITTRRETPAPEHTVICVPAVRDFSPAKSLANAIPQTTFLGLKDYRFNLSFSKAVQRRVSDARRLGPSMADVFVIREGVHSGNVRDKLFLDASTGPSCKPLLFGRDEIAPFVAEWHGKWLQLDRSQFDKAAGEYFNIGSTELYLKDKLVVRRTGDHVLAAVDTHGYFASNNFFVCVPQESTSWEEMCYAAAVLNSPFATWFFQTIQPRVGRLFAELKITHLSEIPLPFLRSAEDADWVARIAAMVTDLIGTASLDERRARAEAISRNITERIEDFVPDLAPPIEQAVR